MESGGKEITVVLADDHNVIRTGLRAMLEEEDDLRVIGEAADAAAARKLVHDRRPDVLVLDLQMPGARAGERRPDAAPGGPRHGDRRPDDAERPAAGA